MWPCALSHGIAIGEKCEITFEWASEKHIIFLGAIMLTWIKTSIKKKKEKYPQNRLKNHVSASGTCLDRSGMVDLPGEKK